MPVLPKSLYLFGAGFLTARTAQRLKRARGAPSAQHAVFGSLLAQLARTEQGRTHGLQPRMKYEAFRTQMPVRTHEQYANAIERMKRGEADVLWPGRCSFYAVPAGTTGGAPRWLPVTDALARHFLRAGIDSLLFHTARTGHCGALRGRHLWLTGSSAVTAIGDPKTFPCFAGEASGLAALHLPDWAARHWHEPGPEISRLTDWSEKQQATIERARHVDLSLIAGMPTWLMEFAEATLRAVGSGAADLQTVWPNLECVVHGGVPIAPYQDELRTVLGRSVSFHEVYPASEAFIAAQDADAASGLRLLTNAGVFYEFIPWTEYQARQGAIGGERAVPLEQVRPGEDYVLVLTTPAGLCRYVPGDVVRFISTEPPRLVYVGRTQLQLTAFGENVSEKQLTDSLVAVCQRHGWSIVNFHVAPLAASSLTGQKRGCHEWWIELRPGTVATPTGPLLAGELDRELTARNHEYAAKRRGAGMEIPLVRLVMPGFFDHWLRHQGKWGGQQKLPRCRSDRRIADDLAAIACFTAD